MHLCNKHEQQLCELGLTKPDDVEAYALIVRTFGEVWYAIPK